MSIQPYNLSLGSQSPTFQYVPFREGPVTEGWNSSYSGGIQDNGVAGMLGIGTPYRRTQLDGAGFSLDFQGEALYLCLGTISGAGYALTVDNNAVTKTGAADDPACDAWPGSQIPLIADGLSYGLHTAQFSAAITNDAELDFYGGIVTLSAGPSGTAVSTPLWIDDRNTDWIYEPAPWPQGNYGPEYNGTHTYGCAYYGTDGSSITASITFNGTSIVQLIGSPSSNTFGYSVQFNNVQTTYNSTNYLWAVRQTFFFAGGLDPTQEYTLTLLDFNPNQPTGPAGSNTSVYCVNLDAVVLVQPIISDSQSTPSGSQPSTTMGGSTTSGPSQSSNADTGGGGSSSSGALSGGAIAGSVIGALIALAIIALLFFLLSRMKKRAQGATGTGPAVFSNSYRGGTPNPPDPIPYVTPPVEPQSTVFTGPSASISIVPALSSVYRNDKSPGSTSSETTNAGISPSVGPLFPNVTSSSNDLLLPNDILQNAPTVDLVTILNQRLRREQADNIEEPPTYG
ncbi:hypothetical protein CALCODRAFT_135365 [Calocera cornea HHB12733]|uniref:Peptidase A1 domain-containing protein n=1 Tax=Calocera cornea HHB12733 TaxID=1353952 RepID=A0A165CV70_9BASI|nr:hypothetical protein CALCODRAFT_135365 [Calocera cornea HHB12733]